MTKELSDESEQIQISVSGFKFGEIALQICVQLGIDSQKTPLDIRDSYDGELFP